MSLTYNTGESDGKVSEPGSVEVTVQRSGEHVNSNVYLSYLFILRYEIWNSENWDLRLNSDRLM